MATASITVPRAFIWRRIHSLMGLWLVLFLIEHLLTNSQATLWLGDNGRGFVNMVNTIHNLPYLEVIELSLLGVPFFIHMVWGLKYLFTAKFNNKRSDGSTPSISLPRNRAYTWQRITSWILLVCIIGHVAKFRFLEYPKKVHVGDQTFFLVNVSMDNGLYTLADRLNVKLFDHARIAKEKENLQSKHPGKISEIDIEQEQMSILTGPIAQPFESQKEILLTSIQNDQDKQRLISALDQMKVSSDHVIALSNEFGVASLLTVRDTFKSPVYICIYTIFVLAACFHACNGFWTFLITWGWVLKMAAQRAWTTVVFILMSVLIFLGLAAVWGTYWINLRN